MASPHHSLDGIPEVSQSRKVILSGLCMKIRKGLALCMKASHRVIPQSLVSFLLAVLLYLRKKSVQSIARSGGCNPGRPNGVTYVSSSSWCRHRGRPPPPHCQDRTAPLFRPLHHRCDGWNWVCWFDICAAFTADWLLKLHCHLRKRGVRRPEMPMERAASGKCHVFLMAVKKHPIGSSRRVMHCQEALAACWEGKGWPVMTQQKTLQGKLPEPWMGLVVAVWRLMVPGKGVCLQRRTGVVFSQGISFQCHPGVSYIHSSNTWQTCSPKKRTDLSLPLPPPPKKPPPWGVILGTDEKRVSQGMPSDKATPIPRPAQMHFACSRFSHSSQLQWPSEWITCIYSCTFCAKIISQHQRNHKRDSSPALPKIRRTRFAAFQLKVEGRSICNLPCGKLIMKLVSHNSQSENKKW